MCGTSPSTRVLQWAVDGTQNMLYRVLLGQMISGGQNERAPGNLPLL